MAYVHLICLISFGGGAQISDLTNLSQVLDIIHVSNDLNL